jgi:anthranilate phosphoribosyltransferase
MSYALTDDLERLARGETLTQSEAKALLGALMTGEASEAQIAAALMALRVRGETVEEISGAAEAMRALSTPVPTPFEDLIDTCGTGGTGHKLFNVSTASAFVAAEGGARVAKHGNRGMTSASGSADLLEAAGARLDLTPAAVAECLKQLGVGFMFAQRHHSAMRYVSPVRQQLKIRTIFNVLGPLTNPAGAQRQVLGVFDHRWRQPLAEVLARLGSTHVLVVHADNGLDEFSPEGVTRYTELRSGAVQEYTVTPEQLGLAPTPLAALKANSPEASLALVRSALAGTGPGTAMVALNAGAALYVAGRAASLEEGVGAAGEILRTGAALKRLEAFAALTQALAGPAHE